MTKRCLYALMALALGAVAALWPGLRLCAPAGAEASPDLTAAQEATLPTPRRIDVGQLIVADLTGGAAAFAFTPATNSIFDVCLFPAEDEAVQARTELWQDGQLLGQGSSLTAVSARLTAGAACEIRLYGTGRVRLEIARHALSRCYADPMVLDAAGDSYSKAIARRGDVHWYALDARAALPTVLVGRPEGEDLTLQAQLFDDAGRLLAEGSRTRGGAFLLDFTPRAGQRTYIRVTGVGGGTGLYELRLARSESGVLPDSIALSREALTLDGRRSVRLNADVSPEGAGTLLLWESSDPGVALVDAEGRVQGLREGIAVVTAYAAGGVSANCRVQVRNVAVTGLELSGDALTLNLGDETKLNYTVLPENACDSRVRFTAWPAGIVEVSRRGVVRAVGMGSARVTVRTLDGGFSQELMVTVDPPVKRYRALLVGEQGYAATLASARLGSANSVAALRSMLETLRFDGERVMVNARLDLSRDGVLAAIRETFSGADAQDFSLFYITCHGEYADGMTRFQMFDGSVLTSLELEQALRQVPGRVLVIVDCCGSGGVIARASKPEDILKGIVTVFGGRVDAPAFSGSKYLVLASAALDEDSYRLSFSSNATEAGTATVFARALCEGGGWDIDRAARGAMRADADYDGIVTMQELYSYASRRVMWYLQLASRASGGQYAQQVQAFPMGDTTPLMQRTDAGL